MPRIPFPFSEPTVALSDRRHAPGGYESYKAYKQWLRDEHDYRCVYCLAREAWDLNAPAESKSNSFGVDHMISQHDAPDRVNEYANLCYCCNTCNSQKNNASLPLPLINNPLSDHIVIKEDGSLAVYTEAGKWLRDLLLLDHECHNERRRLILKLFRIAQNELANNNKLGMARLFGFPDDLPNLRAARPPQNTKPDGIAHSAHERMNRRELPEFY